VCESIAAYRKGSRASEENLKGLHCDSHEDNFVDRVIEAVTNFFRVFAHVDHRYNHHQHQRLTSFTIMSISVRFIVILLLLLPLVQGFSATSDISTRTPTQQQRNLISSPVTMGNGHRVLSSSRTALNVFALDKEKHANQPFSDIFPQSSIATLQQSTTLIPYGIRVHMLNTGIGLTQLQGFANDMQSSIIDSSSHPQIHEFTLLCMAFSLTGTIYDNVINAVTRYIIHPADTDNSDNDFLLQLHKLRFVWHAISMPLLAIPVTEMAARTSLFDESTCFAASALFAVMSLFEGYKTFTHMDVATDLKLVDNRTSKSDRSMSLLGVMSYTTTRPMEVVIPAVLLVLYETLLGADLVLQSATSASSLLDFATTAGSPLLLLACGVSTLGASGMARAKPEIQLLSEHSHMALLWSAYLAGAAVFC
jgi:hypothetical protein